MFLTWNITCAITWFYSLVTSFISCWLQDVLHTLYTAYYMQIYRILHMITCSSIDYMFFSALISWIFTWGIAWNCTWYPCKTIIHFHRIVIFLHTYRIFLHFDRDFLHSSFDYTREFSGSGASRSGAFVLPSSSLTGIIETQIQN